MMGSFRALHLHRILSGAVRSIQKVSIGILKNWPHTIDPGHD